MAHFHQYRISVDFEDDRLYQYHVSVHRHGDEVFTAEGNSLRQNLADVMREIQRQEEEE